MNAERKRLAREIFADALEKDDAQERPTFVAQACGADAELRQLVEALLAAHEGGGELPGQTLLAASEQIIGEGPGTVISHYKLLEQIGEGGFGVVFMAEQQEPIRRRVALKIVKPGMDTRQVIARFEAERQALAMMDNPNIAKVFDAGATESGRPYFVMELVQGVPLTQFCDANELPASERLQLFETVCSAVQHAHQKGIIHRDLKPSNLLVTLHDGKAVPKVIDFGTAKALQQPLTEKTLFTAYGKLIGTPQYMSPEQAELSGLDVDTRADIYSLGVLLYELLTGTTPLELERLRAAGFEGMMRIIRQEEPPTPSTRVSTLGERAPEIAKHRQVDPGLLQKSLRGDLDWIVMKALEKDRARRYETASALGQDVAHHLQHEPVQAGPPSVTYRTRKFIRRHRVGVGLTAALTSALVLGLTAALIGFAQTKRARDQAVKAESKAQEETAIAKAVKDFLLHDLLAQAGTDKQPNREVKLRTLVDLAAERVGARFQDKPLVEAEARSTLYRVYFTLGEYTNARTQIDRVLEIYSRSLPPKDSRCLEARLNSAWLLQREGRYRESQNLLEQLLPDARRIWGPENGSTLRTMRLLAVAYGFQGKLDESQLMGEQVLAIRRRVSGPEHPDTLAAAGDLATAYMDAGRLDEAQKLFEEVLQIDRRVLGEEHPDTLCTKLNLARTYADLNRLTEAEQLDKEVIEVMRRVLGQEHPDTLTAMSVMASIYSQQGKMTEAQKMNEEVLSIRRRVLGPEHPDTLKSAGNLAISYSQQGNFAESLRLSQEVFSTSRQVLGLEHPETLTAALNLAVAYANTGKLAEARKLLEEALPAMQRVLGREHSITLNAKMDLAVVYALQNNREKAIELDKEVLEVRRRVLGEEHPETLRTMNIFAGHLCDQGRLSEAQKLYEEVLSMRRRALGMEHSDTLRTERNLAGVYSRQHKWAEAEKVYDEVLAIQRRVLGSTHPDTVASMNSLAWMLATCADSKVRDGQRAVQLAEEVAAATSRTNAAYLDTLAAAYAEVGDFSKAIRVQQECLALSDPEHYKQGYETRLKLYQSGSPVRE